MTSGAFNIGLGVCSPILVYMSVLRFFTYPVAVVTEVRLGVNTGRKKAVLFM